MHTADRDNEFGFSRCPEIRCSTQRLKRSASISITIWLKPYPDTNRVFFAACVKFKTTQKLFFKSMPLYRLAT
jgi:hypothetical protein